MLPKPTLRCKFLALLLGRQDREEIVAVLEDAKTRLWDGHGVRPNCDGNTKSEYICYTLDRYDFPYVKSGQAHRACKRIRAIIQRRLGWPVMDLAHWLSLRDRAAGQPIPASALTVQALRLDWINALIQEYAPKETQ